MQIRDVRFGIDFIGQPGNDGSMSAAPPKEVQDFVDIRGRPAVFLFLGESLSLTHVVSVQMALANRKFDELDLVIQSAGGDVDSAFQIAELLRLHATKVNACVPYYAKSAATLLCISADEIDLDELAQLGPLDAQVREGKKAGGQYVSALNPFKALEQIQKFALETLTFAIQMLDKNTELGHDDCTKHAVAFVAATSGPLFARLDPEKLGEYSRALNVGKEYGDRLLKRTGRWDDKKRREVLEKLVHGYPSHDYIIDYKELQELGFQVTLFTDKERAAGDKLFEALASKRRYVDCVLPTPAAPPASPPSPPAPVPVPPPAL
jgi:hypothetical protein